MCVCLRVCDCAYVRLCTHLLDTCSAVPCLAAMVLVIVYHFLPIFFVFCFFFFPPPFCFASFVCFCFFSFLSIYWRCCSLLSHCPAHFCDITAGSVQSDQLLVKGVNETLVAQRVVPALITLSSDPEM